MKIISTPITGAKATGLQLKLLNHHPGNEVWAKVDNNQPYRCVVTEDWELDATQAVNPKDENGNPKVYPEDGNKIWEATGKHYPNGVEHFRRLANQGHQIFVIPNKVRGGIRAVDVQECQHIFAEADDRPIPEQWERLQWFSDVTGLVPCLVIYSGGKSLHFYFTLSRAIAPEDWQRLQRKIILIFRSDPQIQNLNREMRLAGVSRKDKQVSVDFTSDHSYDPIEFEQRLDSLGYFPHGLTYERWLKGRKLLKDKAPDAELLKLLATPEDELFPTPAPRPPSSREFDYTGDTVPLEICLTRDDQELIAHGVSSGSVGRNPMGYKLARNAIGTAAKLNQLGIRHSDNGYQLLEDFCRRCNPPLPDREIQRLWAQAQKSNPKASLTDEQLLKRVAYWQWEQLPPSARRKHSEPDADLYAEYVSELEEEERVARSQHLERQRELEDASLARTFKNYVTSQVDKRLKRLANWLKTRSGCGEEATPIPGTNPFQGRLILPGDIPAPEVYRNEGAPLYLYRPGDMAQIWQAARFKQGEKRYKAVLDASLTGVGKSEIAGRQRNENWFLQIDGGKDNTNQKLLYFSQSGQNTTAPSLENWTPLARMHNGLIERPDKTTGGGNPFIERPRAGETPSIPGNCWATSFQHLLAQKNIGHGGSRADEDGDSNPICNLCSERDNCKDGSPSARPSGFKSQMKGALAQPRLKGTLAGFPSDHQFEIVSFIDEAEATIQATQDITASIADLDKEFFRLWQYDKELHDALSFIQGTLTIYLSEEKPPKYGYDFATIKNWFDEHHLDSLEFEWALLRLEAATNELSRRELGMLRAGQSEDDVNTLVTLNWLISFCQIMSGRQPGSVRIVNHQLIITIRNDRQLDLIRSFDFTVLLDATGDRDEIARTLGYEPWEILWVMQVPPNNPYANLRVNQIVGLGKCGKQRRDRTSSRIEATEQAIEDWALGKTPNPTLDALVGGRNAAFPNGVDPEKIAYIRHLKYYNAGELYFFGGSNGERGSNAAQDCQVLVLEGLPRENIGSALGRYQALYGTDCSSDHPDFKAWYNRQIDKRIFQAIGRSRYTRRANQIIPIFIMGDADLSGVTEHYGIPIRQAEAFHIAAEAGTPTQVNGWKIFQALKELRQEGSKVLQRQVSNITNLAQSTISEFASLLGGWKPLIKISEVLLGGIYNTPDISELPHLTEEERAILEEYIPLFLDRPPEEVLDELGVIIRLYGLESFLRIVAAAPLHIQIRMLVIMLQGLPLASINELIALVGGIP